MIDPRDEIPLDDSDGMDKDDQMSQQDIHSNGLEEERIPPPPVDQPDTDLLSQSYNAAESAHTLGLDDAPPKKDKK